MLLYDFTAKAFVRRPSCFLVQMLTNHLFGILNLGHWNLFVIWFLEFGIFMIYIKQVAFVDSVNYLAK